MSLRLGRVVDWCSVVPTKPIDQFDHVVLVVGWRERGHSMAAALVAAHHQRTCNWSHESTSSRVPTSQQTNVIPPVHTGKTTARVPGEREIFIQFLLFSLSLRVRRIHSIYSICQPLNSVFLPPAYKKEESQGFKFRFSLDWCSYLVELKWRVLRASPQQVDY